MKGFNFLNSKDVFRINKGTILIKVAYFISNLAVIITWPFLTVQSRKLGLTFSDISIVSSLSPAITVFTSALLGYLGDKIGYKTILVIDTLLIGAASTCFDLTPRYKEASLLGSAEIYSSSTANDNSSYILKSISWPSSSCFEDFSVSDCENSALLNDTGILDNLEQYIECSDLNDIQFADITIDYVNKISNENGTLCQASQNLHWNNSNLVVCNLHHPNITTCLRTEGSHLVTFAIYFAMRIVYNIGVNSAYMILDACTLVIIRKHNSNYSNVMMWQQIAIIIGPFIASWLIEDKGDDTNYQLMYYVSDGFLALSLVLIMFLKVEVQKTKESMFKSLKYFANFTSIFLFVFITTVGFNMAIHDTYMAVYFVEEYNVNSQFVSALLWIAGIAGTLVIPFAPFLMKKIGKMNIVYVSFMVDCIRTVVWTLIGFAPEIGLGLATLDFMTWTLTYASIMSYANEIAPPGLMATTTSLVGIFIFLVGKGLGNLIGGQLMDTRLGMTWTFRIFAGAGFIIGTILIVIYHTLVKVKEKELIEMRREVQKEMNVNLEKKCDETK